MTNSTDRTVSARRASSATKMRSRCKSGSSDNHLNVAVRCRPMSEREIKNGHQSIIEFEDDNKIVVHNVGESPSDQLGTKSGERHNYSQVFEFDRVFDFTSTQEQVYEQSCKPIVDSVLEGYNGTIFAYGQTGTGKTYTMEGPNNELQMSAKRRQSSGAKVADQTKKVSIENDHSPGIIPRAFRQIFDHIGKSTDVQFLVRASYLEIYQEKIHDLLRKDRSVKLELHERQDTGVYVKDLTSFACKSMSDIDRVMKVGNQNRRVGATDMNEHSSRSHAIFMITIEQQALNIVANDKAKIDDPQMNNNSQKSTTGDMINGVIRVGKLNLVDLAGSERQRKTNSFGQRQRESIKINLSLSALGNVINSLMKLNSQQQSSNDNGAMNHLATNNFHTPYRDSKLTRLLQDSLGGNAKTLMIANIGPASYNYDETINTLNYASRAKCIKNKPRLNEDPKDALLRDLQREIDNLRSKLASIDGGLSDRSLGRGEQAVATSRQADKQMELELLELRQKLSTLESKLLNGKGSSQLDQRLLQGYSHEQELELQKSRAELADQLNREQAIRDELERREEAELVARQSFESIQQEVDAKRRLIRQVLLKIRSIKEETERCQEAYRVELDELDQLQYVLRRELKLKCLIMDNFIPYSHVDQLLPRIVYDERRNSCSVTPIKMALDGQCLMDDQTVGEFEEYWRPSDGSSIRPRSEFERIGETIHPSNIRYRYDNLIEVKWDVTKPKPAEQLQLADCRAPPELSGIQMLVEEALNEREPDIVI